MFVVYVEHGSYSDYSMRILGVYTSESDAQEFCRSGNLWILKHWPMHPAGYRRCLIENSSHAPMNPWTGEMLNNWGSPEELRVIRVAHDAKIPTLGEEEKGSEV